MATTTAETATFAGRVPMCGVFRAQTRLGCVSLLHSCSVCVCGIMSGILFCITGLLQTVLQNMPESFQPIQSRGHNVSGKLSTLMLLYVRDVMLT